MGGVRTACSRGRSNDTRTRGYRWRNSSPNIGKRPRSGLRSTCIRDSRAWICPFGVRYAGLELGCGSERRYSDRRGRLHRERRRSGGRCGRARILTLHLSQFGFKAGDFVVCIISTGSDTRLQQAQRRRAIGFQRSFTILLTAATNVVKGCLGGVGD